MCAVEFWTSSDSENEDTGTVLNVGTSLNTWPNQTNQSKTIFQYLGFLLLWQVAFNISNAAITIFLKAFRHLILLLGEAFGCSTIASGIAITLYQRLNIDKNTHVDYVVCPKCFSLYEQSECTLHVSGRVESKTCYHTPTPNHPHHSKRNACGCLLMKKQRTKHGIALSLRKIFPYRSIIKES